MSRKLAVITLSMLVLAGAMSLKTAVAAHSDWCRYICKRRSASTTGALEERRSTCTTSTLEKRWRTSSSSALELMR